MSIVMINWRRGQEIVTRNRVAQEGPLERVPRRSRLKDSRRWCACRASPCSSAATSDTTPLALRAEVEHTHTLHEKVVIVSVDTVSIPHVEPFDRFAVEVLGRGLFKVFHVTVRIGYHDKLNVPEALVLARKQGLLERNLDLEHASYFVSRITITPTDAPGMQRWRKQLFITMARNAASPIEHFGLPGDRTLLLGSQSPSVNKTTAGDKDRRANRCALDGDGRPR